MNTSNGDEKLNKDGEHHSNVTQHGMIPLRNNSIDSRHLFSTAREITITHGNDVYRLRLTAQNKLILTK
jgi:hemin uptake protein HemP